MQKIKMGLLIPALFMAFQAQALDSDMFTVRGFGSLGVVNSSFEDADFVTDAAVPEGAGRTDDWSLTQMSRLGLQLDGQFNDQWSMGIQGLAEYNYKGTYSPSIPFAYIGYEPTNNLKLRAGRLTVPVYMLTDFARVGYALPWARPPLEMYRNYPLYEGIDMNYQFNASGAAYSLQALYSFSSTYDLSGGKDGNEVSMDTDDQWALVLTADVGSATFRVGHVQSKSDYESDGLDTLIAGYQGGGQGALIDEYNPNGNTASYDVLGLSYDPGDWFMRTELAKVSWKSKSLFPAYTVGYVTAGYRYGALTPYAIYGWYKLDSETSIGSADPFGGINTVMASSDASRSSTSVGLRWNFMDSADLKVQLSHVKKDSDTSNMALINYASGATAPSSYDVIFVGIDFVF